MNFKNRAFLACTVGIGALAASSGARPALAQAVPFAPVPGQRGGRVAIEPDGLPAHQLQESPSLASYLDKLIWDPSKHGNLLIIGSEQTFQAPAALQDGRRIIGAPEPEKSPNGDILGYKLDAFSNFFGRKAIGMHSLSVFAPTTMTVFADRNLPKIDPYAALDNSDRKHLLEATFTPDQWQRMASPGGIGIDDMTATQRELYLSLLPDPFVVENQAQSADGSGNTNVTLTPEQRSGIRLSVSRKLSYMLFTNGSMTMGSSIARAPGTDPTYRIVSRQPRSRTGGRNEAFGVALTTESPNRPKSDQLTDALRRSEAMVPLSEDQTLGALIDRVGKATGAELHADKRYARLSIVARGTSAQAGDLLRAIAFGVTGTWRRVGPAYILTNDLEGLGQHHARIMDWLERNQMMIAAIREPADGALVGNSETDHAGWRDDDPLKPDAALQAKLNDPAASQSSRLGLIVPLSEMPAAMQTQISNRINGINDGSPGFIRTFRSQSADPAVATNDVKPIVGVVSSYIIPGLATISADDMGSSFSYSFGPPRGASAGNAAPPKQEIVFPDHCPARALLVAPRDEADVATAVHEARRAGFAQLWVQVPRDDRKLLASAIRQGKADGLAVQAVVRPLQSTAADPRTERDRNLLGQTTTEYVHEKRSAIQDSGLPTFDRDQPISASVGRLQPMDDSWRDPTAIELLLQKGDYLPVDEPVVRKRLIDDLGKLAATPGLGGLVLRDAYPPGYEHTDPRVALGPVFLTPMRPGILPINDVLLGLGYSENLRLRAIREIGYDPIDLSPMKQGDQLHVEGAARPVDISLPFFHDTGMPPDNNDNGAAAFYRNNGVQTVSGNVGPAKEASAGDAPLLWRHLRADVGDGLVHTVTDGIRAQFASLPVMSSSEGVVGTGGFYFGSVDPPGEKPAAAPDNATPNTPVPVAAIGQADGILPRRRQQPGAAANLVTQAKASSKTAYYGFTIAVAGKEADDDAVKLLSRGLAQAAGWDGVVVDVTELSPARAAALLRAMPDAQPPTPN